MLSRRTLVMILTMFCVVLVLFLSTAVLKEYFNDYGINHSALEEQLPREKGPSAASSMWFTQARRIRASIRPLPNGPDTGK